MAAIRLHPTTKKPSVYWYEPNGKKRQKTFATITDATKFKKIIEAELLTNKYISPFAGQTVIQEWLEVTQVSKQLLMCMGIFCRIHIWIISTTLHQVISKH